MKSRSFDCGFALLRKANSSLGMTKIESYFFKRWCILCIYLSRHFVSTKRKVGDADSADCEVGE